MRRRPWKRIIQAIRTLNRGADSEVSLVSDRGGLVDFAVFLANLSDSGILSADDLDAVRARIAESPEDAASVAEQLIRRRKLTRYQVDVLSQQQDEPLAIGEYLILDRIGAGGMGVIYRVRKRDNSQIQALKVLPPKMTADPSAIRRFEREIRTTMRLSHPNIVATTDSGEAGGIHYLTMEYVDGLDLSRFVDKHGALQIWTVMDCVVPMARALAYAHAQDVIHRDVKPSNVLIDKDGSIRVLDLGLARLKSDPANVNSSTVTDLTRSGTVLGTADYMAPEQALNAKNADERTDIYSLGCTLYFLLAARPMYAGETVMEKIIAHREQPIPSLLRLNPNVPKTLERLFRRMVSKKPDERPGRMQEVLQGLEAIRDEHQYSWVMRRIVARREERWPRSDI